MSNRNYLFDVASREEAEQGRHSQNFNWLAKWVTPVFWYACFTPEDEIEVYSKVAGTGYVAYLADTKFLPERLSGRKASIIALMPAELQPEYEKLYDRFSERLLEEFKNYILLDFLEMFAMNEMEPDAQNGVRKEIALFNSIFNGNSEVELDDLYVSGAFDIGGGVAPFELDRITADELAQRWQFLASGESSIEPGFLKAPSDAEIEYAEQILAEQKGSTPVVDLDQNPDIQASTVTGEKKKSKWKFWKNK